MDVLKGYREIKKSFRDAVLTVGNFDGLHLGHQSILNEVVARAKSLRGQSIVYTFRPHPQAVLSPSRDLELISTYDEKLRLFENAGIDVVIEEPFSREFSGFSAEKFFSDVIVKSIAPRAVFVGYDFGFGKDRSGSLDILKKMCKTEGIDLSIASPLKIENEVCSSSRVRAYLKSGDIVSANRLLGRRFSYQGSVIRGDARGRTIGFPTANLLASAKIQIKNGVYASGTIVTM
ncbi:MAG TPA: riboflavin kinase, partial [Oligoflexia bacterium]|nr:riboflavin kinase [Oligoflexia bacterium]